MRAVTVRVACAQLTARPLAEAEQALIDILAGIRAATLQNAQLVVFPECSYPAYVLGHGDVFHGIPSTEEALRRIAATARSCGIAVAVGVARAGAGGRLRNEAVFIGRSGNEAARYAKIFLWNFDARWFAAGDSAPAFDTEFGRIGMMICADGRMPEIARSLRARGAWLVLDPTAWVAVGSSYERMRNPQVDFMMRVRARENGLWIAAADKAGSENAAVHYVGKSLIVAPDGAVAAIGPATGSAIVTADVVRRAAAPYVARLSARERRILAAMPRPLSKGTTTPGPQRIGVLQGPMGRLKSAALRTLAAQGAGAFIDTAQSARAIAGGLQRLRGLRCAVIAGLRMLAPEPARAAALQGADLIVWARPPRDELVTSFARTRALESRVYVIACCRAGDPQPACVVDPSGAIVAEALAGTPSAFVVAIDTAQSRDKLVVPGTDAFAARVPRAFEPLEAAPR